MRHSISTLSWPHHEQFMGTSDQIAIMSELASFLATMSMRTASRNSRTTYYQQTIQREDTRESTPFLGLGESRTVMWASFLRDGESYSRLICTALSLDKMRIFLLAQC